MLIEIPPLTGPDTGTLCRGTEELKFKTPIGTIRATTASTIEITTPGGEVIPIRLADFRSINDILHKCRGAADMWMRKTTGKFTPRVWLDGTIWMCEYNEQRGQIVRVVGRSGFTCRVCDKTVTTRWEAKRIKWATPALPILCDECHGKSRVDMTIAKPPALVRYTP